MVLARSAKSASELSRQIREGEFVKEYQAVLHGFPAEESGTLRDLLGRDKARKMTYVAMEPGKDIQEAVLDYWLLSKAENTSRVRILLHTGRTHQIRVQFASRGFSVAGDRKYGVEDDFDHIALWSHRVAFTHPETGEAVEFTKLPPKEGAWAMFAEK
jgi:23S rRNA pseudouridine1911/1915/1917 synthase